MQINTQPKQAMQCFVSKNNTYKQEVKPFCDES